MRSGGGISIWFFAGYVKPLRCNELETPLALCAHFEDILGRLHQNWCTCEAILSAHHREQTFRRTFASCPTLCD